MNLQRILWLAAFLFISVPYCLQAEDINPPFGLHWGETEERLERLLKGAKATIVQRKIVEGREAWDVERPAPDWLAPHGILLPQRRTRGGRTAIPERTIGTTRNMTVSWAISESASSSATARGSSSRGRRSRNSEGDITQTLVGWKWNQNNTAIELVYFSAVSPTQVFRTLERALPKAVLREQQPFKITAVGTTTSHGLQIRAPLLHAIAPVAMGGRHRFVICGGRGRPDRRFFSASRLLPLPSFPSEAASVFRRGWSWSPSSCDQ